MGKTILITHTDLDGAACILVSLELYKDDLKYYCCNPDKADSIFEEVINKYPLEISKIVFADMCFRKTSTLDLISKYNITVEVYDHHVTAQNFIQSHRLPDTLSCIFTVGEACGALNLYQNNLDNIKLDNDNLETFLMYVNDHDLFTRKYTMSDNYNIYFNAIGMYKFISRGYGSLSDSELYAIDVLKIKEQEYIDTKIKHLNVIEFSGKSLAVVIADDCPTSMLAENMRIKEIDCDGLAVINLNSGLVSLRSIRDSFNCAKFARKMSKFGGGHEKASGFPLDQKVFTNLAHNILTKQINLR